jgi:hypothetical protein
MPTDVIIDPTNGQIYWNDSAGSPQSISIKGDAQNAISFVGYSGSFSPGSTPAGASTLVTVNDNSGTDALVPGTSGFNLGSSTLRWNTFATNANLSGTLVVSDSTISSSLLTGSVKFNGGIAISGNASIGQSLNFYNTSNANYVGFKAGVTAANTLYTLPTNFPGAGTSVLQSDTSGVLTWVGSIGTATTATNVNVVSASTSASHPVLFTPASGTASGAALSTEPTFVYNPSTDILSVSGLAITSGTASTSPTTGALIVAGGVGISGRLSFNQSSFGTTGIATIPTMAMIGQTGDPIFMSVLEDNSISFEGSQGQLFSITPNLTTGYIWSVNDISGVPFLRASVGGTIGIAEFGGVVGIGQTNPIYKLDLKGNFGLASSNDALYNFIFSNSAASGSNSLQIRSANSLLLYNSGNSFYTGLKSNASANVTYTLPVNDGSADQFLKTNGSGVLSWGTPAGGSGGGSTGVGAGGQYELAYYPGTGASVIGNPNVKTNTVTSVVSIDYTTASLDYTSGALKVSGGVGIGGSLFVGGIGASISGITISNSAIIKGAWNGTVIAPQYGGTGQNLSSSSGVLTISSGTVSASTTSSAISSVLSDETGSGSLVFGTQPSFGTGVTTGDLTFAVFNTTATTINAFGAATTISLGAATGTATFNSTNNTTAANTGAVVFSGGVGIGKSVSIGGYLQLFNGANYTSFVSSATANTVYTLPATSPATGSSVLQSTSAGVMSWVPMVASGGAGSGTVAIPDAQYRLAYYAGTGASVSSTNLITAVGTGVTILGATNASSTTVAALSILGGLGVTGNAFIGGTTSVTSTQTSISTNSGALVVSGGVGIGGSLYTSTSNASSISGVVLLNNAVTASTINKVTVTAPATSSTLTIADGSSLITSGTNSLTLTTTATTNATFPSGTKTLVATDVTSLASLNTVGVITSGTWAGTVITALYGGTGFNSYTIGDILVGAGSTFIKLNSGSTNFVLTSTGTNSVPSWQAVPSAAASSVAVAPTSVAASFFITAVSTSSGSGLGLSTITSFVVNPNSGIVSLSGLAVTALTQTTSSSSGALIVTNGAAVGQTLSVGGSLNIFNGANYSGFRFAGSANTTYTLPPNSPQSAVGTSVLTSTIAGVMSWVGMSAGGSATPGGSNKQIQYNNSSAFGGAAGFEFTTGGIANTVSIFSASGTGYTSGLWIHAINGSTTRVGIGLSNPAFELEILGEISATNKSFVIDHPTKQGMKLRYGSLEGPENGVYVRGELENSNIIEVPDHWIGLVHEDSYTVHLTPIGKYAQLYVEKIENYNVFISDANMNPIHCYYSVWAERKDIPKLVTEYEAQ